jgi:hypothetical protein
MGKKESAWFVHEARTYRVRAGARIRTIEAKTKLSRSTIGRIESDSGTSEVSAWAYFHALKEIAPGYPHQGPFQRPFGAKVSVVKIDADKLK